MVICDLGRNPLFRLFQLTDDEEEEEEPEKRKETEKQSRCRPPSHSPTVKYKDKFSGTCTVMRSRTLAMTQRVAMGMIMRRTRRRVAMGMIMSRTKRRLRENSMKARCQHFQKYHYKD